MPAYWVFGRNKFRGYVTARKAGQEQFQEIPLQARKNLTDWIVVTWVAGHNVGDEYLGKTGVNLKPHANFIVRPEFR